MKNKNVKKKLVALFLSFSLLSIHILSPINASAAGNLAFSVGCNYPGGESTERDATSSSMYYGLCGYSSRYTSEPTLGVLRGSHNGTRFMESDIIMLSGHGNSGGIYFESVDTGADFWVTTNTAADTQNNILLQFHYTMNNVKLIIFDGCETALEPENCASIVVNSGCKAAIGWTVNVGFDCMYEWKNKFNNYLATGNTISNAIRLANSFNYGDNSCKSYRLYGIGDQVLKLARTNNEASLDSSNLNDDSRIVNKTVEKDVLQNKNTIEKLLKTTFSEYSFEDFRIDASMQDDGSGVITVVEKIGDFYTDNAYVIFYDGNKVTEIFNRVETAINITEYSQDYFVAPLVNGKAILSETRNNISSKYKVLEQGYELRFDVETGEKYYYTRTVIEYNGAKSVINNKHII